MILLAAIAATTYFITRKGGVSEFIGGESSPTAIASTVSTPSRSSPSTATPTTTSGTGSNEGGSEEKDEEEDECDLCSNEGDEESTSAVPSKTSDSYVSTPPSTGKPPSSGGGLYGENLMVDFSTLKSADDLSSFLSENGLRVSTDEIGSEPITHTFLSENVSRRISFSFVFLRIASDTDSFLDQLGGWRLAAESDWTGRRW